MLMVNVKVKIVELNLDQFLGTKLNQHLPNTMVRTLKLFWFILSFRHQKHPILRQIRVFSPKNLTFLWVNVVTKSLAKEVKEINVGVGSSMPNFGSVWVKVWLFFGGFFSPSYFRFRVYVIMGIHFIKCKYDKLGVGMFMCYLLFIEWLLTYDLFQNQRFNS